MRRIVCYDWTDNNVPPQYYISSVSYGPYCASGRDWEFADIDNDGRNEHYMLVGETYAIWGRCEAKPGHTVLDFLNQDGTIHYGCADGACNEQIENFYYSRTYTEPAVVYPISYPDMFCWASGATNTWGWPGYILYDDYGGYTEGYLVVYCGMDADCPVGQYCSKPYLGNPASFYCAPNTAPTVIDLTQYPTSLYRGQSIEIRCKVSDAETQPQNLEVTIEYQRGGETGWNSCADTWDAGNQWWECTKQTELDDVALGLWDFRCKVSDGTTESQWTIDVDTVTVMNNIPYFAALPSQQISEDTPGSQIYLDLWSYSSDVEDNNVVLGYSIDSQSNPALINCFITQQRFFTCNNPAPESSGTSLINIRVADSDNGFNVSSIVVNVTAVNDAPFVMLIYPPDNYHHEGADAVNFTYNVNDVDSSALANCSLYIDSQLRQTEYSPPMNTELVFSEYIAVGTHTWYIGCTDNEGTLGTSEVRNILYFNLSGFNYSSQYFVYNISDNFSSLIVRANLPTYSWIDEGKLQPDCSDLRIVNSGYNMTLPFEIENNTCNNAEFNATVWHTGEIRANQNNTFYVFYGSSNAQSENNNPTPWNDPNLIAVWHLSDNRTDGASDSGKYGRDLRVFAGTTPPETVNGVFGHGTNLSMSSAGNHYPAATDKFYLSEDITPFDPSNTAGNWTVSAWFKVIQFPTYGYPATLIAKSQTHQGHPAFALYLQANRAIGFAIEKNPCIGQAQANGIGEITPDVWHYAVGKYNGTHVSVYLDGQLNASTAWSGGMATCANHPQYFPGPVSILCWYFNTNICAASHGENIQFDEIQIYNRSVVDKEIIAEWSMKSALKANEVPIVLNLTEEPSFLYRGQDIEIQCKVTDPDTPAQNLNVTIEYQRGSEAGWNACTETWDAANQWWECTKTAELTDNALGYWDFRCKVSDGTSESQWTIDVDTVSVLNNNPYFLETLPAQQLPEDGNGSQIYLELLLYSEDIEDGDPALSHSIESQSNPALIDCFISQQQFFTCSDPAPESSGTSLINISVADSDNGSNVSSVVVNVTAVNDAPIVSLISPEDDHIERNTKNITFVYIPTDIDSSIQQCSLNIGNETSYTMSFYTNWSSEQGRNGIYYKYHDQAGTWYDMEYSQSEDKWYAPNNPQSRFWREAYQNIMFHPGTQPGQAYPYPALWWVVQSPGTYKLDGYVSWNFQNGGDGFDVNITINGVKKTSYYVHTEMPIPINTSLGNLSTGDIVAIIIESRANSDYDWGKFTNMTIKGAPTANDTEIENNVQNIFTKILENGNYIWNIACFDGEEYGYSENRDLWINIHHGGGKSLPYEQYGSEEI